MTIINFFIKLKEGKEILRVGEVVIMKNERVIPVSRRFATQVTVVHQKTVAQAIENTKQREKSRSTQNSKRKSELTRRRWFDFLRR